MNIKKLFSNRRMVVSLAIVVIVAAAIIGGTIAYFQDVEVSQGNVFKAGKFNLKIDNTCHYNDRECICIDGVPPCYWNGTPQTTENQCFCTWELKDLAGELYFNFLDVKPGDNGEDTISLHVDNNDAWICAEVANLVKDDNGCEKPESDIDTTCGAGQGELQDNLFFSVWKDNGVGVEHACNNVKDDDETYIVQDQPAQAGFWPIADSLNGTPLQGDTTYCLGVKWNVPIAAGNEIQTDSLVGDVIFRAVQSRNMDDFVCSPTITLIKNVINDNGGTANPDDFGLKIDGASVLSGVAKKVNPGAYVVGETNLPGYTAGVWGGDCDANGNVSLNFGDNKTCTITNDNIQPLLTVTKVVNGGTKQVGDFPLFVDATPVTSGVQNGFNAGARTVSETPQQNYTAVISGDCAPNGNIVLAVGEVKSCTITNTYVQPQPVTVNLNPNPGTDTTDVTYTLNAMELYMLAVSDDRWYWNQGSWTTAYDDNKYIEFQFPDIPTGATVNSVVLKFEWQRRFNTNVDARLRIYDGSNLVGTYPLSAPSTWTDYTATVDLKAWPYTIDTAAEVNNLKIRFQATSSGGGATTDHDWVQVDVTYTL